MWGMELPQMGCSLDWLDRRDEWERREGGREGLMGLN